MAMLFLGISLTINIIFVLGFILYFKIKTKTKKMMNENFEDMLGSILTESKMEDIFEDAVVDEKQAEEFWS